MSSRSTALLARKSLRARLGRTIAIMVAIFAGVSFVVGSFVLADSLRATFTNLFTEVNAAIDLQVRSTLAVGDASNSPRDPIPAALADEIAEIDGVSRVEPYLQRYAQFVAPDGTAIATGGAPLIGLSWSGDPDVGLTLREGRPASGPGEVAMDKATADRIGFSVGDPVVVLTDTGRHEMTIVGTVGLASADGFAGATLAAFDFDTARELFGAGDQVDVIDLQVAEGVEIAAVQERIEQILPPRIEVVTGEQVTQEDSDALNQFVDLFGNGLLIFAFITAFVSAFIINNVFAITIGQRLRELALLRAVGAGATQVRRMISFEAFGLSVIATVLGILGGVGFARFMIWLFNATGLGFPDTSTVLLGRTVVMAFVVGVGITMLSVLVPARRAGKVPPVAAMRPELGFSALSARRLVLGSIVTSVGAVFFLVGLFVRPGGTPGLITFAGGGGLMLFLGTASLSSTVARPVTRAIGWPIQKLFGTSGMLARENAARQPRRTSASAAALMIGVSLVSAAAVFAASLRDTFTRILDRAVTADYIVGDASFQGMPPAVADTLRELPELAAVSPLRVTLAELEGDQIGLAAADPATIEELVNVDVIEGSVAALAGQGLLVHTSVVDDRGLGVGSSVEVLFPSGIELDLEVVGVFTDNTVAGSWLISLDTWSATTNQPPRDFLVVARLAEGADPVLADEAVRAALVDFPQLDVQTNAQFRQQQEDQINQLLIIITALLFFAILIAVLGISITLALSVFERTREIGLLRAVGMNKRQTRRSVRWEAVIVSLFGALVGIVLGSLIGVALSIAVPNEIIEVISFSPSTTVIILIGAVLAGLFAALYPSYKASNMDVLEAIATE